MCLRLIARAQCRLVTVTDCHESMSPDTESMSPALSLTATCHLLYHRHFVTHCHVLPPSVTRVRAEGWLGLGLGLLVTDSSLHSGDLTVARLAEEEFYLVTLANQPQKVADHLTRIAQQCQLSHSTTVQDITEQNAIIAVNGPDSRNILSKLSNVSLDNEAFAPGSPHAVSR